MSKNYFQTETAKVKDNSLETRDLQATLEKISHTSDEHKARGDRLEREKPMLNARAQELESQLRQTAQHLPTTCLQRQIDMKSPGRALLRSPTSGFQLWNKTLLKLELLLLRKTRNLEPSTKNCLRCRTTS